MTKYKESECSYVYKQLGILINTRNLNIGILDYKWVALEQTLRNTWYHCRKIFMLRGVVSLLCLVSNLALATSWAKYTHVAL